MFSKKPEERSPAGGTRPVASSATFSVLGADVVIKGDISASADLYVDGRIEGDISCASLVQGESSRIEGTIEAETARLAGNVKGTIAVRQLVILKSAVIEGDVRYDTLTIEQDAQVQGHFAHDVAKPVGNPVVVSSTPDTKDDGEPRLTLAG
ncbi:MAG: polymer-forming cytoskeletal protein [Porphyrobacter sp.]|nr:polymer-forming cytoskeletal protein [Porphyrobacter sp.]